MESLLLQIRETASTTADEGTDLRGIRDLMSLEDTLSAEQIEIKIKVKTRMTC